MNNRKKPNQVPDKDLSIATRPLDKSGSKKIWQYQNDSME